MVEVATINSEDFSYKRIAVKPIAGALGAEIEGVNIAAGVDQETQDEIYRAWLENNVIFFRNQSIAPKQQIDFAKQFGKIHLHLFNKAMDDHPEITEVLKTPEMRSNAGGRWHSDQMYTPKPAKATMLYSREMPEGRGDTMFSNMYLAYESLSEGMKASLIGLRAIHNGDSRNHPSGKTRAERVQDGTIHMPQINPGKSQTISSHPVVRTHPETGKKALYFHITKATGVDGLDPEVVRPFLDDLLKQAIRPDNTLRHQWRMGDVVICDNRCAMHSVDPNFDQSEERLLWRIILKGDQPV